MSTWRNNIRKVTPYIPGEQPRKKQMIKLNTNENPYPPSPMVMEKLNKIEDLRLYPDPNVEELVHALEQYHGLSEGQVFVGVGSDDVLGMSFLSFFNSDKPILFPDITYSFYDVWAELYRIPYKQLALNERFHIVAEDYKQENGGIVFPNPNAPTSILEPVELVEDIVKNNPGSVVIVDEAYIDFGGETCLDLIHQYDNLLVVRTYSKSRSLAGLRVGYCMGNVELIQVLNAVKQSYNSYTMNQAAITLGAASLADEDYFKEQLAKIINTRTWVSEELRKLHFTFEDSSSNFLFIAHETVRASELFEALKEQDIYVRYFDKPRIDNYLRVTIGTDEEMHTFVDFLKNYLNVK